MSIQDLKADDESLQANWGLVDGSRKQLAAKVVAIAESVSGGRRLQLRSVGRWLNSDGGYEQVLKRPDVINFCLPWVKSLKAKANGPLSDVEADQVARLGFCRFCRDAPEPRSLVPFIYPICAILFGMLVLGFASFTILPTFEQMFKEFGIELPRATKLLFFVGRLTRQYWWIAIVIFCVASTTTWIFTRLSQRQSVYSRSWIDWLLDSMRPAVANWTGHLATLLNAGVAERSAVQVASECSAVSSLRSTKIDDQSYTSSGWLDQKRFALVNETLTIEDRSAKAAMLREVAVYYRSISATVGGWWLKVFAQFITWQIALAILFTVASLFMPLISIISGLTGVF
jgi:hypothetical protein